LKRDTGLRLYPPAWKPYGLEAEPEASIQYQASRMQSSIAN